jgi:hypothetical protein
MTDQPTLAQKDMMKRTWTIDKSPTLSKGVFTLPQECADAIVNKIRAESRHNGKSNKIEAALNFNLIPSDGRPTIMSAFDSIRLGTDNRALQTKCRTDPAHIRSDLADLLQHSLDSFPVNALNTEQTPIPPLDIHIVAEQMLALPESDRLKIYATAGNDDLFARLYKPAVAKDPHMHLYSLAHVRIFINHLRHGNWGDLNPGADTLAANLIAHYWKLKGIVLAEITTRNQLVRVRQSDNSDRSYGTYCHVARGGFQLLVRTSRSSNSYVWFSVPNLCGNEPLRPLFNEIFSIPRS